MYSLGNFPVYSLNKYLATEEKTTYSQIFTMPDDCENTKISFCFGYGEGTFYIDDIQLNEVGENLVYPSKTWNNYVTDGASAEFDIPLSEYSINSNVSKEGKYSWSIGMNTNNLKINKFSLVGNYSFDGCKNVEVHDSKLISKDAFWNTENVTVYDSFITGEYLGWNAKNLTLINCTIESLQGLCYIDNLVMKNCKLINTTLAFEYSSVDADICSKVDSIINPGGTIRAKEIGELIIEKDKVDPEKTKIICEGK